MKYPAKELCYKPSDDIKDENGRCFASVLDYWVWAHSNMLDNAERGIFAEFIVSKAVNSKLEVRENWAKYDVVSEEGITIEVKTSAYIQTWGQNNLSTIRFGIEETQGYDKETNIYENEKKRQAQVYVFCVHNVEVQEEVDILDMSQWDFYVLSSKILNDKYKHGKSIGLNPLIKLGAKKCSFDEIHDTVIQSSK